MKIKITRQYCGYVEIKTVYSTPRKEDLACLKCHDRHTKVKELEASKIDYYAGAPAFKVEEEEPFDQYWGTT